jgi:ABC-2 type transport system ATP-binding protein
MIEVKDLTKEYGPIRALRGVSFVIEKGEVVGFLGPNGAGKTTCMKIVTGFISATSGTVTVDGMDVVEHGVRIRKLMGYLPENAPLYPDMTVRDYLHFVSTVRGVPREATATRVDEVARTVGINERLDQEIGTLSKGFRQRTGLAQAMIHDPGILILDEPTSGLDPNQIVEMRALIKDLGKDRTVILSTHNLPEVTATCNRIIIIHAGRIVADGQPGDIQAAHGGGNSFLVEVARAGGDQESAVAVVLCRLKGIRTVSPLTGADSATSSFRVEAADDSDPRPDIFASCVESGWTLLGLRRERLDLEAIFQRLTT